MGKKAIYIVAGVLAALLVLSFAKNSIVKSSVEKGVKIVTGLRLSIRSLNVGIIRTLVDIKDLRLFNPKGFKDRLMVDMPEIYVDYDLPAILGGKVHLNDVRINLKEFVVVKNEKGELNLDSLKVVQQQEEKARPAEKEKGKAPEMQIDNLQLKIGKVIYKDYSQGGAPSVREFDVNIDERYQNITDPQKLVSLIVVKALQKTTIARLTDFDVGNLKGLASDTLATAEKITTEAMAGAGVGMKKTGEVAGETVKGTTEVLKKTAEDLKEAFKLPFGTKESK